MVVVRNGKKLVINVTDYDPENDGMPESSVAGDTVQDDATDHGIPPGWESLAWPQLRALAAKVNGGPVQGRADAVAVIRKALEG